MTVPPFRKASLAELERQVLQIRSDIRDMVERQKLQRAIAHGPSVFAFNWWDDARDFAIQMATATGLRHKVTWRGAWFVDVADRQRPALTLVAGEPCS